MKRMMILFAAAGLAVVAGCKQGGQAQSSAAPSAEAPAANEPVKTAYSPEEKQEFSQQVDTTLADAQTVAAKVDAAVKTGKAPQGWDDKKVSQMNDEVTDLKSKYAMLQAATTDYDDVRTKAAQSLQKLQDDYFAAASQFQDQRAEQERRVTAWIADMKQKIAELQTNGAQPGAQANAGDVKGVVDDLQKRQADVEKKLIDLKQAKGDQWARLRGEINDDIEKTRDAYWDAMKKAKGSAAAG
ncbi:MAG: hypothetical protein JO102_02330 [Elusimicrobia bacterium]|nr:hypothetical protein [Elusimicrobiota bacterium]